MLSYFIVVQGSPIRADIGAYVQCCLEDAYPGKRHATLTSAYRGADAEHILNRHGKHSQRQLWEASPAQRAAWGVLGTPNRPGHSSHELFSDGNLFFGVPDGRSLAWWQQGVDVSDPDVEAVIMAAAHKGWKLARPYPSGIEHHHLGFAERPKRPALGSELWRRLVRIRATYPRN